MDSDPNTKRASERRRRITSRAKPMMAPERVALEELATESPYRALALVVRILHLEMSGVLQRRIAHENVSVAMSIFIRCLWERDGMTQRELADAAKLVEGTTADILQQMEMSGLIVRIRNVVDRRKMNIYLTQPAKSLYQRLKLVHQDLDRAACHGISDEEMTVFLRVAERMTANLGRDSGVLQVAL